MMYHVQVKPRMVLPLLMFLLFSAMIVCSGCTNAPQDELRIGTNVWPGYEPLYLARQMGYYDATPVKLVEYTSASEAIRAFRNGAVNGVALTLDEAILLAETDPDLKVVLVMDTSDGADVILAKPEFGTLQDLKGKRIGTETTALGAYVLTRALQNSGMNVSDVIVVPLEVGEHQNAYETGAVDAVVTFEPVRTNLLNAGAHEVFNSSQIPGEVVDVLVIRGNFLKKDSGQVQGTLRGWFKALDYMKADPARAFAIMGEREHISAEEFESSLNGLIIPNLAENRAMLSSTPPGLKKSAEQLKKVMSANNLTHKDVDTGAMLDGRYVEVIGKDTGK